SRCASSRTIATPARRCSRASAPSSTPCRSSTSASFWSSGDPRRLRPSPRSPRRQPIAPPRSAARARRRADVSGRHGLPVRPRMRLLQQRPRRRCAAREARCRERRRGLRQARRAARGNRYRRPAAGDAGAFLSDSSTPMPFGFPSPRIGLAASTFHRSAPDGALFRLLLPLERVIREELRPEILALGQTYDALASGVLAGYPRLTRLPTRRDGGLIHLVAAVVSGDPARRLDAMIYLLDPDDPTSVF